MKLRSWWKRPARNYKAKSLVGLDRRVALGLLLSAGGVCAQPLTTRTVAMLGKTAAVVGGLVTAVEVLGDISVPITSPSSLSIPMQTNGSTLRVATSGTAAHTALDVSKISLTVSDNGWDTSGNQVARTRTVKIRDKLYKPWGENATVYQPNPGEFYLKLDDYLYNQDATWLSTIVSVNFAAGWLTGQGASVVNAATRSDSLAYPTFPVRGVNAPYDRQASGATYPVEVIAVHPYARNMSMVACVEAWIVDGASTAGTAVRTSSFTRSPRTPNDATLKGFPVPTYQLPLSAAGLTGGRVDWRWTVKPWIGPSVSSAAYGDVWPTLNPAVGVPFCYDADGSHAPLYGYLSNEQASAPSGKTLIASNTTVTTVDMTGLSTTMAGAAASNKVYADLATLATAIRRVNKSAAAVTIADPVTGAASFSYQRPTLHDDLSGGVAVCPPVTGSVTGSHTGGYSMWINMSSTANYPSGLTMFEIRSESGQPSTDVRWLGEHSDGSALAFNSRVLPQRTRLRGLNLDSSGITTQSNNNPFAIGNSSAASKTEAAAFYMEMVDCIGQEMVGPSSTIPPLYQPGYIWQTRCDLAFTDGALGGGSANFNNGCVVAIGGGHGVSGTSRTPQLCEMTCVLGAKLRNIRMDGGTLLTGGRIRPDQRGRIFFNMQNFVDAATVSNQSMTVLSGGQPTRGGEGWVNVECYGTSSTTNASWIMSGDSAKFEVDCLIMFHCSSNWPNSAALQRLNLGYQEQGVARINKRIFASYVAASNWNTKDASFNAPENATNTSNRVNTAGAAAWDTTKPYYKGQVANDTTNLVGYEAIQDVPIGTALTNTAYWVNTGTNSTAYGPQALRTGNDDLLYSVACRGNVTVGSGAGASPDHAGSWLGKAWDATSTYNAAAWNTWFVNIATADFSPAPGTSPLLNRVPAGSAVVPFDLLGITLLNDGTDSAGARQVTH